MQPYGHSRTVFLLVVPALAFIIFLFLMPLGYLVAGTFEDDDSGDLNARSYVNFVDSAVSQKVYARTLRLAVVVTVIAAVVGYPVSYAIARMRPGRRAIIMSLIILPLMTNPVARTYAWLVILGRRGLINYAIETLRLRDAPLRLLYTETAIALGLLHLFFPLMILTLVSAMENIRPEYEQAARSLGANRVTAFARIIMPLSADGLILGGTLVFTGCITAYVTPRILGGTRVLMLSTLMYQRAMVLIDWDAATVVAVVMVLTTLVVNLLLRRLRPTTV